MEKTLEVKILQPIVAEYEGELDPQHKRYHGVGTVRYDNTATYQGTFQNGLFHGKGTFLWPDHVQYDGDFDNGTISGQGSYKWPDESKYDGTVSNGKRHGTGVFDSSSQQHYEGTWENGLRHGKGIMYYNQTKTTIYSGGWQSDKRHGFGTMTYESGNTYEGEWRDDLKSGRGVMLWADKNEIYLGDWQDDLPNGQGEHIWFDTPSKSFHRQICNIYRGSWQNGMRNGYGCFFYANGSQYAGEWKDNLKHGLGTFIHPNGKITFGEYDTDRLVSPSLDLPPPPAAQTKTLPPSVVNDDLSHSQPSSHKSVATVITSKDQPSLRETDSVNVQYHLNINDVLFHYPVLLSKTSHANQTKDIERLLLRYNSSVRLILKRYSLAANVYRNIQNSVKSSRRDQHPALRPPTAWNPLELLMHNKRSIQEKFFTLQMQQLWQIARDCDLIGPLFTAYDVCECVRSMHVEHSQVSLNLHRQYFKQQLQLLLPPCPPPPQESPKQRSNSSSTNRRKSGATKDSTDSLHSSRSGRGITARSVRDKDDISHTSKNRQLDGVSEIKEYDTATTSIPEESELKEPEVALPDPQVVALQSQIENLSSTHRALAPLLDTSFEKDVYHDPLFPIREREFMELIIRIIAEVTCRRPGGLSSGGLFDSVYRMFAEILEPLASESRSVPVFVVALYSESVQLILRKRASALRSLWDQVLEIANQGKESFHQPQVKHVVKLMRALRGTAISEEGSSVLEILEVINKKGPNDDISSLDLYVMYDDFIELFCRLVVSNLWIFAADDESATLDHRVSASEPDGLRRANSRITTASIVEQALSKRLAEWLKLI